MIKAIAIIMCTMVGLLAFAVLFFLLYSIFWMVTEKARETDNELLNFRTNGEEDDIF